VNDVAGNLKQAFDVAIHMEKNFPLKNTAGEIDITWARKILASRSLIPDIVTWKRALSSMENPILATIKKMTENTTPEFIWHWQYQKALKLLTLCLTEAYEFNAQPASGRLNSRLEELCPQLSDLPPKITDSFEDIRQTTDEETKPALPTTTTTLSHRALRVAVSGGAHSVLLGVRSLSQIKEARGVAAQAPLDITQVKEILAGVASRSVTEPDLADSGLSDFGGLSVPPLPTFPKPK
jgi:hypothetical protein